MVKCESLSVSVTDQRMSTSCNGSSSDSLQRYVLEITASRATSTVCFVCLVRFVKFLEDGSYSD